MAEVTARDAKLIQYLNEAFGKEKELETALRAHISMTTRAPYKKRLQQHLKETKSHARQVAKRIRELGGKAEAGPVSGGPEAVSGAAAAVTGAASKAVAAAKGPLHAIRGTGEAEKMLKNARTEFSEEAQEIAFYTSIETLATSVGDKATAKLAKTIRREEERMANFLEKQIATLTKAVAQEEIPAKERRASRNGARSSSRSRSKASSTRSRSSGSRSAAKSASSRSRSSSRTSASSRSGASRSSRGGSSRTRRSS